MHGLGLCLSFWTVKSALHLQSYGLQQFYGRGEALRTDHFGCGGFQSIPDKKRLRLEIQKSERSAAECRKPNF